MGMGMVWGELVMWVWVEYNSPTNTIWHALKKRAGSSGNRSECKSFITLGWCSLIDRGRCWRTYGAAKGDWRGCGRGRWGVLERFPLKVASRDPQNRLLKSCWSDVYWISGVGRGEGFQLLTLIFVEFKGFEHLSRFSSFGPGSSMWTIHGASIDCIDWMVNFIERPGMGFSLLLNIRLSIICANVMGFSELDTHRIDLKCRYTLTLKQKQKRRYAMPSSLCCPSFIQGFYLYKIFCAAWHFEGSWFGVTFVV